MTVVLKAPFRTEQFIEDAADAILAADAHRRGSGIQIPIPVEDLVEFHLGLEFGFDDLHKLMNLPRYSSDPDVLGGIWVRQRRILIDSGLDPAHYPKREGRFRFRVRTHNQ